MRAPLCARAREHAFFLIMGECAGEVLPFHQANGAAGSLYCRPQQHHRQHREQDVWYVRPKKVEGTEYLLRC